MSSDQIRRCHCRRSFIWNRSWLAAGGGAFGWRHLGLVLCFVFPLLNLAGFAAGSELYSYILLIPFISFYLVWIKRQQSAAGLLAGSVD